MSHFYGSLKGTKGEATRCGDKKNGLCTYAASWSGAVKVDLTHREDGVDWASVYLVPWQGSGVTLRLYEGPVCGPKSSELDEALRCVTCVAYDKWKRKEDGPKAHCEPSAPNGAMEKGEANAG
jgi:hypothetical protein